MQKALRSNLPAGSSVWAARRAQWRALGLTEEDMQKPKIAVVNSSSELAICFSHLDDVATEVKQAIREAGGLPFEIRTVAPSDFVTSVGKRGAYILPSRDLVTNDVEVQVEGALLDGMVSLASCDKTTPGQLMAAGRLNIPSLVVACGYQSSGSHRGEHLDIEDVFLKAGAVASGGITVDELTEMTDKAVTSPGVCAGMGTANSMHVACEALGMSLPGSTPVQATSDKMLEFARASGRRVVEMVHEDLRPRDVMTAGAFANAVRMVLTLSGSINCVKHLQAIAAEAEVEVDLYEMFGELAADVPLLAAVRPSGDALIEDLERAGGARAVLKRLEPQLDLDVTTVTGRTLGQELADVVVEGTSVIHTLEDPLSRQPAIIIVKGSLLPGGGIVRLGGTGERTTRFRGTARIFHSREEALEGIDAGQVRPGDVVVLRGLGACGGPGMALTSAVVFALEGAGLIDEVATITEGQVSGLVNRGLTVAEASPEAAEGGPLALLDEGDTIAIDVPARTVDLEVPSDVLAERAQHIGEFGAPRQRGWLGLYQRTVQPVHKGAVLGTRD